jgi:pimeloyl-ACP methyl ester carboxylesterase
MANNNKPVLYTESGGEGETTYLLLHGLGATGDVWHGIKTIIKENRNGRWIIPDMRGHGRSDWAKSYGLGDHSCDIADLIRDRERVVIIGHSMGGLIGLSLATGWFSLNIIGTIVIGTMVDWNADDTRRFSALADKPIRWFNNEEDALARYLQVSGLNGLVPPESPQAKSGIVQEKGQFRLAADNATGTIGGPWMSMLMGISKCPVILAAGEHDPIVTVEQYRPYDGNAVAIPGVAHNAHVEDPVAVWALVEKFEVL